MTVEDALRLLDRVQQAASDITDAQRGELLDALTELRAAVESEEPDTGEVVEKVGKLGAIADKLASPPSPPLLAAVLPRPSPNWLSAARSADFGSPLRRPRGLGVLTRSAVAACRLDQ